MRYTFNVTADDIAHGHKDSPCGCPIALAICRTLGIDPELGNIDVDDRGVFLARNGGASMLRRASGPLPKAASQFMRGFDAGRPVEPFTFRLAIWNWYAGVDPSAEG
jgi:hypothetical protein